MTGVRPRVAIVHAPFGAATLRDIARAAHGRFDVTLFVRESLATRYPDLVALARVAGDLRIVPDAGLAGAIHGERWDGVTTFHDDELAVADEAALRLGLPGVPAHPAPWDKLRQRETLAAAGISAVRTRPVGSPAGLTAAVREVGLPGVLKPRRGTASVGVAFLRTGADVTTQLDRRPDWTGLLYESLIPGAEHPSGVSWLADYVSVETVSDAAGHHHVAVFDKVPIAVCTEPGSPLPVAVRESGDVLPTRLPPPALAEVLALTSAALTALGITGRVSHTELKVSSAGAQIIEVNGRLGGEVARMVGALGGPDLVRAALDVAVGRPAEVSEVAGPAALACLYLPFARRAGTVRSAVTRSQLRALPGVVAVDEVPEAGTRYEDCGFRTAKVTVAAPDTDALDRSVGAVMDGIAALFADDGMADDPWLGGLRGRLREVSHA